MADHTSGGPIVTVAIGSYNHERFLPRSLRAIEEQTYQNLQVIIADDASSDGSAELIDRWIRERRPDATFIRHERNTGVCQVLNEVLDHATGTYVTTISADDWMEPNRIERLVEEFEQAPDEVGLIFSGLRLVDAGGQEIACYHNTPGALPSGWIFPLQLEMPLIPSPTAIVRRSAYDAVGRYHDDVAEDYDMWLRITRRFEVRHIPDVLVNYRWSDNQMTTKVQDDYPAYEARCLRRQLGFSPETDEIIYRRLEKLEPIERRKGRAEPEMS